MMVTGGPGTGKSSLVKEFANTQPEIYQNAVQVNPDDYKDLLADRIDHGKLHAEFTHEESSLIAKNIVGRLDERMANGLPAPHVMMDVVSPNSERMTFAIRFDEMNVAHGTAPPEVTLQRAYDRGFDADGNIHGRIISSHVVLDGAAKASERLPNVFDHQNLEFKMVNTDVPYGEKQPTIALWDNDTRRLTVQEPDLFIDFIERQHLNANASNADELFSNTTHSAEALANDLKPYTDKGVTIDFMGADDKPALSISNTGAEVHAELPSKRGSEFMQDLADSTGKLGRNGGIVAGAAFGTLSALFTLHATGDTAQAAEVAYETIVPYGETQFDLAAGDLEAAAKSATIETASNIGSVGGAAAGALAGAALGSVVPIVGTAVGGVVGGLVGAIGGGVAVGEATDFVYDHADDIADWWDESDDELLARLPTEIDESAPPELQHLVEIKRMLVETQSERRALGTGRTRDTDLQSDRRALTGKIERIEQMYDEAYDTYEESGTLESTVRSLDNWERAEKIAQHAIENITHDAPKAMPDNGINTQQIASINI